MNRSQPDTTIERLRRIPVTVKMMKSRQEIPPKQKVYENRRPWRFIFTGKM